MTKSVLKAWILWFPPALLGASLLASFLLQKELFAWIQGIIVALSFLLGLILWFASKRQRAPRHFSRAFLSLITMKGTTSIPLILTGLLAFTWLVGYLREMNWLGSIFSLGLLWATLSAVVLWEAQQRQISRKSPDMPPKTKGLIISLSGLSPQAKIELHERMAKVKSLGGAPKELREWFDAARILKTQGRTDLSALNADGNSVREAVVSLLEQLLKLPLYTPFVAMAHHFEQLDRTWVLRTTRAKQEAWEIFEDLARVFFPEQRPEPVDVQDPNDVSEVSARVNAIYEGAQRAGISEDEVTADITGGTASMSAGIILACVRKKRRVEYLRQDYFVLQPIDVTVRTIPWLIEEFMEQLELLQR